jgi:hypothetical protein
MVDNNPGKGGEKGARFSPLRTLRADLRAGVRNEGTVTGTALPGTGGSKVDIFKADVEAAANVISKQAAKRV